MSLFQITYELRRPIQEYHKLFEKIRKLGVCLHLFAPAWIVETHISIWEIRDQLKDCLERNDEVFVTVIGDVSASLGLDVAQKERLFAFFNLSHPQHQPVIQRPIVTRQFLNSGIISPPTEACW